VEWIDREALGLIGPCLADELVGREAFEGLEPSAEVIGCDEAGEVAPELFVAVVTEAPDGGILNGSGAAATLPTTSTHKRL